ncbi:hypothetical protein MLD38_017897 [Melastoma candidum]|uniref:Uncharacterized protein n=1 Tax=Melastoma candidum TaxID=119954 RepID=A0ACB9QS67_9MYRT|nr:hypothetical protein MLD38_017897 [Melastoma candidum]
MKEESIVGKVKDEHERAGIRYLLLPTLKPQPLIQSIPKEGACSYSGFYGLTIGGSLRPTVDVVGLKAHGAVLDPGFHHSSNGS